MPHSQDMRVGHVVDPGEGLEGELEAELELPAVKRGSDLAKVTAPYIEADPAVVVVTVELGVIPGVEGVCPELQFEPLREGEGLLERQVKVVPTGTADGIESKVTVAVWACKAVPVRRDRSREISGEPLGSGLWVRDTTIDKGPRSRIADDAGSSGAVYPEVKGSSRFLGNNRGDLPTTHS